MQYKTYLFDFDYTLANSEKGIVMCFEKLLKANNYPVKSESEIKQTIGLFMPEAISILTGEANEAAVKRLQVQYSTFADKYMTRNTFIYDTVTPVLEKLKSADCLVGIVSNKTRHRILETLCEENIAEYIDIIIGTENAEKPKPAPEPIWQALRELRTDKKTAVYIGDSTTDAKAAANAGIDFAAVLTGETKYNEFDSYNYIKIMRSLAEIC